MILDWFKKLFTRKTIIDTNIEVSNSLAVINIDSVQVRKESELTPEEKELVNKYYHQINPNDYKSILKYSEDILEKSNEEREILRHVMDRYENLISRNKSNTDRGVDQKTAYRIMYSKLALIEYDMVKKSIDDTGKLLELKLIALNKIIKDESKKHLEYLLDHSKKARMDRLKNEMIRIKTSIVINNQIATGIKQDLDEFGKLDEKNEILKLVSSLNPNEQIPYDKELRIALENYYFEAISIPLYYEEFYTKLKSDLKKFAMTILWQDNPHGEKIGRKLLGDILDEISDTPLASLLINNTPSERLNELFTILATYTHKKKLFICKHKDYYKKWADEINNIVKEYENTSVKDWNLSRLQLYLEYYANVTNVYLHTTQDYLNEKQKQELYDAFHKLHFIYDISHLNYQYPDYASNKQRRNPYSPIYGTYWDNYLNDEYKEKAFKYYAWELMTKVEKSTGIKATELREAFLAPYKEMYPKAFQANVDINHPEEFIKNNPMINGELEGMIKSHFIDFYDFIGDKKKIVSIYFSSQAAMKSFRSYIKDVADKPYYADEDDYLTKLTYVNNGFKSVPLQKIFYTLRCLGVDDFDLMRVSGLCKEGNGRMAFGGPIVSFFSEILLQDMELSYDERILTIPGTITMYASLDTVDDLNLLYIEKPIAVYVPNKDLLKNIAQNDPKKKHDIRYVFVNESTLEAAKKDYILRTKNKKTNQLKIEKDFLDFINRNKSVKIIVVPDNIDYTDLSDYLDAELDKEKENEDTMKLVK